jgi:protein-tyrosine phosphatase
MFSGWFSRRNKNESRREISIPENMDWSFLGADIHSHFIPGIDDGAQNMEETLQMLKAMQEMGFKKIVTTPHIMIDMYPNTQEKIAAGLADVRAALAAEGLTIELAAAAEYFIDETFIDRAFERPMLTITGKEVLVEFSSYTEPPMLKQALFKMVTSGYRPIIAHPERYNYFHNDFDRFADFKDRGCLLQLNLMSLAGFYGPNIKKTAEALLEQGMYDYCGTDIHNQKHVDCIRSLLQNKVIVQLSEYPFRNKALCS